MALCAFWSTALAQRGGYDLLLYRRMAAAALAGQDPYSDPYADFPPLKMLLFAGLERAHAWFAFGALVAAAVAALGTLLLLQAADERRACSRAALICGLGVLALPPLFLRAWVQPLEDKGVYVALLLCVLLAVPDLRRGGSAAAARPWRVLAAGALVGLVQAYGGAGLLLLPLLLAWPLARRDWRAAALLCAAALFVTLLACVPYWPHWTTGYARRAAREHLAWPAHISFWLLWVRSGLPYGTLLPALAAGGTALLAGVLFWVRRISLHPALALVAAALLLWGPEASYDRILAGALPLLLLLARSSARARSILVLACALSLAAAGTALARDAEPSAWPALVALWLWPLAALAAVCLPGSVQQVGHDHARAHHGRAVVDAQCGAGAREVA